MRGAIAAGHPLTAEAGAQVLREGGNAIDACVAAAFAAAVVEGPLTGPAGGGFLLVHEPSGEVAVLDCFFAVPSRPLGELEEVVIDFADSGSQAFSVGDGSVAVPGLVTGLQEAHRRYGTRSWRDLVDPAVELARTDVSVIPQAAFLHEILAPILLRSAAGSRIYGRGDRLDTSELALSLEQIRDGGAQALQALLPMLADDLAAYEVGVLQPQRTGYRNCEVLTTPEPSRGGEIICRGLAELAEEPSGPRDRAGEGARLALALSVAYGQRSGARLTGTTHIAVLDEAGLAASLSSTLASGSGIFRGGFQLNNMLGEFDVIGGDGTEPGARLPSMMAPTIVREDGSPRLVLGSAGSTRVAGAIIQVVDGVVGDGLSAAHAIARPRLHVEGNVLHVEGGASDRVVRRLSEAGFDVVCWADLNLFFGGVQAVERTAAGDLAAAGDPRRGGVGVVVS
jgi:gamma-glutamyltranspeptidase/glutathione hydrolase